MDEFDDLRSLTDDEDDYSDFSFDDIVDDEDDFAYGQEIDYTDEFSTVEPAAQGPITKMLGKLTAQQRMIVALMLFVNAIILSFGLLVVTGRI